MNSKRFFYLLVALLVLINGAGVAAIVLGNKYLEKQNTHLTDLKVEANTLDKVQVSLARAKKDIDKYSTLDQIIKTVVPQEKDQARTVREIIKIADESHINIASVGFSTSSLGSAATGPAAAPGTTSNTGNSGNTQTQKVEGISNVERLEITVASDTSKPVLYSDFIAFLAKLEQNRRTSQVSSINIVPVSTNRNLLTFSMVLNVYIKK